MNIYAFTYPSGYGQNPYIDLTGGIWASEIINRIRFDDAKLGIFSLMECKVTGQYVDNGNHPTPRIKLNKRGHCRVRFKRWKRPSSIIKSATGWRFYGEGPFITAHSEGCLCFASKEKALAFLAEWKQSQIQ